MTFNKKKLFLGVVLGSLGISLYNSYKNSRETSKYMKKTTSNYSINSTNLIEIAKDDNIIDYIDELKNKTNILEEKLNKFKK